MKNTQQQAMFLGRGKCFPLRKGDIVIQVTTVSSVKFDRSTYYTLTVCGNGGKRPREKNGSPIDTLTVVGVIRPGWELPPGIGWADSLDEAIEMAKRFRP